MTETDRTDLPGPFLVARMFSEGHGTSGAAAAAAAAASGTQEQQVSTTTPESFPASSPLMPHAEEPPAPTSPLVTRLQILSTQLPDYWVAPICGASAGVASGIVTCPLDVIKTKLQAQGGFARRNGKPIDTTALYRGMLGTGRTIWREDGIRGLYQGLGPMLLGYLPTWAVYLAVYDRSREYFYEQTGQYSAVAGSSAASFD